MDYGARQKRLADGFKKLEVDAVLVTHMPNVRYLTGFTGSAGVFVAAQRPVFTTDGRYSEQATHQVERARVVVGKGSALASAVLEIKKARTRRLGIEAEHMTVATRRLLSRELGRSTKLIDTSNVVEKLRIVKDRDEIQLIRKAVNLGSELLPVVCKALKPGQSEFSAAAHLEFAARERGAEAMSFETIVAAGKRSALPHGVASAARLPRRGFVVLDYGVILNGYCSDMTRTVCIGRASSEQRRVYDAVLEAQLAAIAAVAPGRTAGEVDEAARSVLKRAGLGKYFIHSTGHGVGLEIHESPKMAARQTDLLQPGMVITIEPGVYIGGKFGVRIEDMVLVTERGSEVLTRAPKVLLEL
jgi:Xaa-Pro aminopeptidase